MPKVYLSLEYAYNLLYQGYETTSIIDNLNNIINKLEGYQLLQTDL